MDSGVQMHGQNIQQLNQQALKGISLRQYPTERAHFLIHAIQYGQRPPSATSMKRTQIRNQRKLGQKGINLTKKIAIKPPKIFDKLLKIKKPFVLPQKYDAFKQMIPCVKNLKLGKRVKVAPKIRTKAFKIQSHENLALKSLRNAFKLRVQKKRQYQMEVNRTSILHRNNERAIYFIKKKKNQKRRRMQKHQLIKNNKKRLHQIFGDVIYQTGWPISRKQIREALGIKSKEKSIDYHGVSSLIKSNKSNASSRSPYPQKSSLYYAVRQPLDQPTRSYRPSLGSFPSLLSSGRPLKPNEICSKKRFGSRK